MKQEKGLIRLNNRLIQIKILKEYESEINTLKSVLNDAIKYCNQYDNGDYIFYQIYLKNDLTLNDLIALKDLKLKSAYSYYEFVRL